MSQVKRLPQQRKNLIQLAAHILLILFVEAFEALIITTEYRELYSRRTALSFRLPPIL